MDEIQKSLREKYAHIHPLMFQRSCEKCRTNGELFDILETIPTEHPLVWNEDERRWIVTDLLQFDEDKL